MNKLLHITMLYDFYGELLTPKQKEIFELYHFNDHSLNEIAEEYDITKQAVMDTVKRAEKSMLHYEEVLSLIEKHSKQQALITSVVNELKNIRDLNNLNNLDSVDILSSETNLNKLDTLGSIDAIDTIDTINNIYMKRDLNSLSILNKIISNLQDLII